MEDVEEMEGGGEEKVWKRRRALRETRAAREGVGVGWRQEIALEIERSRERRWG